MEFPYGPNEEWEACCEREREEDRRAKRPVKPLEAADIIIFFAFIIPVAWAGFYVANRFIEGLIK